MFYTTRYNSPIGLLTIAADETHIIGLWIEGQKYFAAGLPENYADTKKTPALIQAEDWLSRYFAKEMPSPAELPLAPAGSAFQQAVWRRLCAIPYGKVTTYKAVATDIAQELGRASMSAQAVGGAVGRNPISIIIPCHRVIGSDGSLTGYAGGLSVKRMLLELEGSGTGGKTPAPQEK